MTTNSFVTSVTVGANYVSLLLRCSKTLLP